jgi:predicted ATPase/DNA-binding SARP family transcriptional activator/Tfp pilus assembly protein PilF
VSALPFERRTQLLAYLALRRAWVNRAEIAAMLWPDQEAKLAYTNLRKTLFRMQSLPWAGAVEVQGGALRFLPSTDVFDFEAAVREGRTADAVAARRGDLLAGFEEGSEAWSSWLAFERDRLAAAWRAAVLAHLAGELDPAESIALSARLLEADPLDEAALRAQMSALAASGQHGQARNAYRDFVQRLRDDLGLDPAADLQALHDSIGGAAAASTKAAAAASPADAGFVGRSLELRRIAQLMSEPDGRLLCLIGPGGVGKTRLARRALEQLQGDYPAGVAFVPLEDATDAQEAATQVARALDIHLAGRAEPLAQVAKGIGPGKVLLVLDTFEHLVGHAAAIERLLRECPNSRLIVTSRVRLGIAAERLLPVDGLPCPGPEDHDRLEAFDAVRLFVTAARRVSPGLDADAEAEAIAEICRQVDGLPLALELAAAWTRALPCSAIAQDLRQGTELLRAVDSAQPKRHASIEMVFDHSWALLGMPEREALARLSIFRGGFAVEAARPVAGASLPVLGALSDKSLLRKDGDRLYLHPLVQQLASLKLLESESRAPTQRAHAMHFHRLLAQLNRAVEDGDREALRRLDEEFENCRVAWRWAATHAPLELPKGVRSLLNYCDHRGRLEEGLLLLGEAIESPAVKAAKSVLADMLAAAAHLEYRLDRYAEAEASASRALKTDPKPNLDTHLQCLVVRGGCALRTGRLDEARRNFRLALEKGPAEVDPHNAAAMLDNLALIEKRLGNYDEALRLSLESLAQHRRLDDVAGVALCLNNLGSFYLERGDFAAAKPHLGEALVLSDRHGHVTTKALVHANLCEIAVATGDLGEAQVQGGRAVELARAAGNRGLATHVEMMLAVVSAKRGELDAARTKLAAAMEAGIAIGRPSLLLTGAFAFAELLAAQGERACARHVLTFAAAHPAVSATERDYILERLSREPGSGAERPWPGMELLELAQRIVAERDLAHAPLISALK